MKQIYKKIIAFSLLSFGAAVAMDGIDDHVGVPYVAEGSNKNNISDIKDRGLKSILRKQIARGAYANDPYAVLGITKKTSQKEIEDVAKKMLLHFHSDKNNDDDFFSKEITNAKERAIAEKSLHLGLTYGIQKYGVKTVKSLIVRDVKNATDQIIMTLVIQFLRTNVATPIRRLFIHSDDELEKLQEELYLLEQERTYNDYAIQKMSAQADMLKTLKLEIKTKNLNEQLMSS